MQSFESDQEAIGVPCVMNVDLLPRWPDHLCAILTCEVQLQGLQNQPRYHPEVPEYKPLRGYGS